VTELVSERVEMKQVRKEDRWIAVLDERRMQFAGRSDGVAVWI